MKKRAKFGAGDWLQVLGFALIVCAIATWNPALAVGVAGCLLVVIGRGVQ